MKFATAIVSADILVKLTLHMPGFDGVGLSADDYFLYCETHDKAHEDGQHTSSTWANWALFVNSHILGTLILSPAFVELYVITVPRCQAPHRMEL